MPDVGERAQNAGRAEHTAKAIIATDDVIVRPGDTPGGFEGVTYQTSNDLPAGGEFQIQAGHVVPKHLEAAYRAEVGDAQADSETVDNLVAPNTQIQAGVDAPQEG